MTSLVSDFLINPVLRQARRLSEISRPNSGGDGEPCPDQIPTNQQSNPGSSGPPRHETLNSTEDRPASSSTESTQVGTTLIAEIEAWDGHLSSTATMSAKPGGALPEDDGMKLLRKRLLAVQSTDIPNSEKARLMHEMLMEGYRRSQRASLSQSRPQSRSQSQSRPTTIPAGQVWEQTMALGPLESLKFWQNALGEPSSPEKVTLTAEDMRPTYAKDSSRSDDISSPPLGCSHYRRNVKLQCSTCQKWYTCRFCHDAVENHSLIRKDTKNMLCMYCCCPQRASEICVNCGEMAARYYCNVCKLWDDDPDKNIYHCHDCGICRRGRGLGKDFFHCKTCCACISVSIENSHKCIERSTDCDCPICGEYMFTSPKAVVFMSCGHSIHQRCYHDHMKTSYKCPLCNRSLLNMEIQFRNLDLAIQSQPMPPEFRDTKAVVLCNDCSAKSSVTYHWLGLKCGICFSYNTVELQMLGGHPQTVQTTRVSAENDLVQEAADTIEVAVAAARADLSQSVSSVRRRHSSHGLELRQMIPDRLARSVSPPTPAAALVSTPSAAAGDSDDSDNDMFGFWARDEVGNQPEQQEDESDYDDSDSLVDVDDGEDDEDSDDEIVLIGHR